MATREQLQEWGRRGGKARAQMPDFIEHQRRAGRRSAEVNDMAALGRRGAKAYARRYGYGRLFHICRKWRIENPSQHEWEVMEILEDLGVCRGDYQREAQVLGERVFISVDFYLPKFGKIIEVQGKVHYDPFFDHPNYPQTRARTDAERLEKLEQEFDVLVLDYRKRAEWRSKVETFLGGIVG